MDLATLRRHLRARLPDAIGDLRAKVGQHAPDALAAREAGYTIVNAAGEDGPAVLRIYDEIWWLGVNAEDVVRELDEITADQIRVEINSPGGDVFDGIAIYNALRTHKAHITTRVDGIAASIASVIAQAGDTRQMLSSAQMMIHNAWGLTIGDHRDHNDMRALLEQQDDIIAGIYASRSGGDRIAFRTLMDAETWLTDERAVAEGLADEIIEPAPKPAPDARGTKTLHDEISQATAVVSDVLESAERVDALRAERGKPLSNVNRESLDELRGHLDRLTALLDAETPPPDESGPDIESEYLRFVALTRGV